MATVRLDIEDFINDGYEFPATGGTLEINCEENSSEIYSIAIVLFNNNYENVISDVTVEDGMATAEVIYDDSDLPVWWVSGLSSNDYFTISITVPANETTDTFTGEADFLDANGDNLAMSSLSQVAGSSPAPVWEDGQHKIYRSGQQVMKMYRSGELIYLRLNPASEEPEPPTPPSPLEEPVTLTITAAGNIKWYAQNNSYTKTIQYSKNGGEWTNITSSQAGTMIPVVAGDVVRLRGDNAQYAPVDGRCSCFSGTTAGFTLSGNIMSLVDSTNFATLSSFTAENVFMNFFNNCTGLTDASDLLLPATALTNYCYQGLLAQCTSLLKGPLLSVETLTTSCYAYFYYHTYNLQEIRCLAVTTTASNCLQEWVNGVQTSSGTFYKNPNKTNWGRGNAGVPNNWTIVDYS